MSTTEFMRSSLGCSDRRADDSTGSHRRGDERSAFPPDALVEAKGIAALFASVRPCDGISAASSRSGRTPFDAGASPTTWILDAGLKLLRTRERDGIVDSWSVPLRNRWSSLVTDEGCDVRIGEVIVTGPVQRALLDWIPISVNELAVYETGLFREAPANALALLVRPPTIWPIDEALTADRRFPRGPRFEPDRFDAIERYALRQLRDDHLVRTRRAVARVATQVPVERFPCASATIVAGCTVIARDHGWCAAIAARQLARYASSSLISRATGSWRSDRSSQT